MSKPLIVAKEIQISYNGTIFTIQVSPSVIKSQE